MSFPSHVGTNCAARGARKGGLFWVNSIQALRRNLTSVSGRGNRELGKGTGTGWGTGNRLTTYRRPTGIHR